MDDRVLREYRAVLPRPKILFEPAEILSLLDAVESDAARVVAHPLDIELADAADIPFLEVAVSDEADSLVTGNARHFKAAGHRARIKSPSQFVERWKARGR